MSTPEHLSNHHRNTLRQIFQHPVSHNVEWRAVVSLLEAVGSAVEQRGGKVAVTLGSQTEYLDPPAHKALKELSEATRVPIAVYLREAIADLLSKYHVKVPRGKKT